MLSLPGDLQTRVAQTIVNLDSWFETMHGPGGYGGPIAHWWESSLLYCGPMIDWRYEGLLCGYISLYRATGEAIWLERTKQAGDDIVAAQLPSGKYRNSSFQQGPMEGGTPHEAGVDVGLLELAKLLHELEDPTWQVYYKTAQRNLDGYILAELWNGQGFTDMPWNKTLVPNKNATIGEALILYETLSGQDMSQYLDAVAHVILSAQERTGPRAGGIVHRGTGHHQLAISIYTARAVNGLVQLYQRSQQDRLLEAITQALTFLIPLITPKGVYFGRYRDGSLIANPRLIAGAGDVLRAMLWGQHLGLSFEKESQSLAILLSDQQLPSGGIPTGYGFAWRGSRKDYKGVPEFRDVLPVVGWCDKAFRGLIMSLNQTIKSELMKLIPTVESLADITCCWENKRVTYIENATSIKCVSIDGTRCLFSYLKGKVYSFMNSRTQKVTIQV